MQDDSRAHAVVPAVLAMGVLLLICGCGGPTGTPPPGSDLTPEEAAVAEFALSQFDHVRREVDPTDTSPASVLFGANHVAVTSSRWIYCLDRTGRQVFRPVSVSRRLESSLTDDLGAGFREFLGEEVPAALVEEARTLAESAYGVLGVRVPGARPTAFREVILARSADLPDVTRHHRGRTTLLFGGAAAAPGQFTTIVVLDHIGLPHRVETTELTPEVAPVAHDLDQGIASGAIHRRALPDPPLRLGTFWDPWAYRLEISAWTYESDVLLTTDEPGSNPYSNSPLDPCWELPFPEVPYRDTQEFKYWQWYRWDEAGRLGGFRGNFDASQQEWEFPNMEVVHHASLGDYGVMGGTAPELVGLFFCETNYRLAYSSVGNQFETAFHDDLEACHVGVILSHGGPKPVPGTTDHPLQFRAGLDDWAYLRRAGDPPLGTNRLRYLLIGSCASMNWWTESPGAGGGLEGDWMRFDVTDGLRMACGHDGEYDSTDYEGWTFFSYYNLGEKVTDSWHLGSMKYSQKNCPVTVAYGASEAEALATLFDQRFEQARAGTGFILAVASYPAALAP